VDASRLKRVIQDAGHCGPTTLEMLYSFYGQQITQHQIAEATGKGVDIIHEFGCRIDELSSAIEDLTPYFVLLAKYDGTIEELYHITEELDLPAGVEWRCEFCEPDGTVWADGHYSVVTNVNLNDGIIRMRDPDVYDNTSLVNEQTTIDKFVENWWDENCLENPSGEPEQVFTAGMIFVLVERPKQAVFEAMSFEEASLDLLWRHKSTPKDAGSLPNSPTGVWHHPCDFI